MGKRYARLLRKVAVFALMLAVLEMSIPSSAFAARMKRECNHEWSSWKTTRSATCTTAGKQERTCRYCGETETRNTAKKSHSYGNYKVTKAATCTKEGEKTAKCKYCGRKKTVKIDKKAHKWGAWTVTVEPTDFTKGKRERKCSACGRTKSEGFYPEGTLLRGDSGDAVKEFQEALNASGYDCGEPDGKFGKMTVNAVNQVENKLGVEEDGIGWPGVQKALKESPKPKEMAVLAPASGSMSLSKSVLTAPTVDLKYFEPDDKVEYSIVVDNDSEDTFYDVEVWDYMGGTPTQIATFEKAAPGFHQELGFTYYVKAADANYPYTVTNTAYLAYSNETGAAMPTLSASAMIEIYQDENREPYELSLVKEEYSTYPDPEHDYYTVDDVVEYRLTCTNTGKYPLINIEIYDNLVGYIGSKSYLAPNEACVFFYMHKVLEQEVPGIIYNNATAIYDNEIGNSFIAVSNTVEVPTDMEEPPETPKKPTPKPKKASTCVRTLKSIDDRSASYKLDYCADHSGIDKAVETMVEAAEGDDEALLKAWQAARSLWQDALDEMYTAEFNAADSAKKIALSNEHIQFAAMLENLEPVLNLKFADPIVVAVQMEQIVRNRCIDMCYETNTAPGARADHISAYPADSDPNEGGYVCSLITGNEPEMVFCGSDIMTAQLCSALLQADTSAETWDVVARLWRSAMNAKFEWLYVGADKDVRTMIDADKRTFESWLTARRELLEKYYPNSAIPAEVNAETIMSCAVGMCYSTEDVYG